MRLPVHGDPDCALASTDGARYGGAMKIGDVQVCASCLKTPPSRAEIAARRCTCGGSIIVMPRGEVEKRKADRR